MLSWQLKPDCFLPPILVRGLEGFGGGLGHLLVGSAGGVHGALDGAEALWGADGHALEHLAGWISNMSAPPPVSCSLTMSCRLRPGV